MAALFGLAIFVAVFVAFMYVIGGLFVLILAPFGASSLVVRTVTGLVYAALAVIALGFYFGLSETTAFRLDSDETSFSYQAGHKAFVVRNTGTATLRRLSFHAQLRDCSTGSASPCPLIADRTWAMHVTVPPGEARSYETRVTFSSVPSTATDLKIDVTGARSFY